MNYLKDRWWHECNDFHGSLWLPKGSKTCPYCEFKEENGKVAHFNMLGGNDPIES